MKAMDGYRLIAPGDLAWRPSNLMRIPNADYLERTGSEILGARLWRLPPRSANTLHRHVRAEEFYFVVEGIGRMRVGDETLTVPRLGSVLGGPSVLRQIFNESDSEVLWLVVGAPETEFEPAEIGNMSLFYPVEPTQLPPELKGVEWPPRTSKRRTNPQSRMRGKCLQFTRPLSAQPLPFSRSVHIHARPRAAHLEH